MQIRRHLTPQHFLHHCQDFLEQDEAMNNIILGLSQNFTRKADWHFDDCLLYEFSLDEKPEICCLKVPGHRMLIYGGPGVWERWMPLVVANIRGLHPDTPGILGPQDQVSMFSELWGTETKIVQQHAVMAAKEIQSPKSSSGKAILATNDHKSLIQQWFQSFVAEATPDDPQLSDEQAEQRASKFIEDKNAFLWEDKSLVSMALNNRTTRNCGVVSYVYTPTAHRKHGYASQITAHLSRNILDNGKSVAVLHTDLANPTSNKIYKAMGYEEVGRMSVCDFI